MLRFLTIQNRQGKVRFAKYFTAYTEAERQKLSGNVYRLIMQRSHYSQSNFVELVYRRYAGLYFCACIDAQDNELACLEAIHLFVEILDAYFDSVCELDLVFHFYKVHAVLDEVFLAGEIEETNRAEVLARLDYCMEKILTQ